MSVEIHRLNQLIQPFVKFKIKIDGETQGKIKNAETEYIEINRHGSVLQVGNGLEKSNKLLVNDGDKVEMEVRRWTLLQTILAGLFSTIYIFFSPVDIVATFIFIMPIILIPSAIFPVVELRKA